jgi:hypothetical protein
MINTKQSHRMRVPRALSILVLAILMTLSIAQIALAYMSRVEAPPYTVDLVDYQIDTSVNPHTATAVYAVTVNTNISNAISHVGFDLAAACDGAVDPVEPVYTSLTSYSVGGSDVCADGTYNCYTDEWTVEIDNSHGMVKFECANGDCLKTGGNTLLFKMMVSPITNYAVPPTGTLNFEIKSPSDPASGTIAGPVCETTAVSLSAISASSGAVNPLTVVAAMLTIVAGGTAIVPRKRS